jgi:hypothetical protein
LNLGMKIVPAQDQAEAMLMVETGRAVAFVQDRARGPDCQHEGSKGLRNLGGRVLQA